MRRKVQSCMVALLSAVIMLVGLLPTVALAEGEAAENTPPALTGTASYLAEIALGSEYSQSLFFTFTDADDDPLTYKVSIDGADPVAAESYYRYRPTEAGEHTLVFRANDGTVDSTDTYTVTLTVTNEYPVYIITSDDGGQYSDLTLTYTGLSSSTFAVDSSTAQVITLPDYESNGVNAIAVNGENIPVSALTSSYEEFTIDSISAGHVWVRVNDGKIEIFFDSITVTTNITVQFISISNTPPALISGVSATDTATVAPGSAYTLDLTTIFEDADGDALTYAVSIDGAAAVPAATSYSYTPEAAGVYTLVFTANDGAADSTDTYTGTLTVTEAVVGTPELTLLVDEGAGATIRSGYSVYDEEGNRVERSATISHTSSHVYSNEYPGLLYQYTFLTSSYDSDNYDFTGWYVGGDFIPVSAADAAGDTLTKVEMTGDYDYCAFVMYSTYYRLYLYNAGEASTTATPVPITSDITVEPVFEKKTPDTESYTATAVSDDDTMGTAQAANLRGNTWTIAAEANDGYVFSQWSDGNVSAMRTMTLSEDAGYVAYFVELKTLDVIWDEDANAGFYITFHEYLNDGTANYSYSIAERMDSLYTYNEMRPDLINTFNVMVKPDDYDSENYDFLGFCINGEFIPAADIEAAPLSAISTLNTLLEYDLEDEPGLNIIASYNVNMCWYQLYFNNAQGYTYGQGNLHTLPAMDILSDITVEIIFAPKTGDAYTATAVSDTDTMGSAAATCIDGNLWEMKATASEGYEFDHWSDGSIYATHTVVLEENTQYTAYFREKAVSEFTAIVQTDPDTELVWAKATDLGDNRYKLEAGADTDYAFAYWEYDGETVSTSAVYTATLTGNRTYTAHFEPLEVTLTGDTVGIYAAEDRLSFAYNGPNHEENDIDLYYYAEVIDDEPFDNSHTVATINSSPFTAIESESVDAYDNAILWFSVAYPGEITMDITANIYAGDDTSGELLGSSNWTGMVVHSSTSGKGVVKVPVASMFYTDNVTVELIVDGGDTTVKTYTMAAAVNDTGFLDEREAAVLEIKRACESHMDTGFSIYSSEYLMINDVYRDGIEAVKDAETAAEITGARTECLTYMEDASNSIYHTGIQVGCSMGFGLIVVTVPEEVNAATVMCAALEQAWPGEWYLSVTGFAFGWWINHCGLGGTGDLRWESQQGAAMYAVTDGVHVCASLGVSSQWVWEGAVVSWGDLWQDENPSIMFNAGNRSVYYIDNMQWDLAELRMSYSDEYLTGFESFNYALAHLNDDETDEAHKALLLEFFDFLCENLTEGTKDTIQLIVAIDLESAEVETQVAAARSAYDALAEDEQSAVFNFSDLTNAEASLLTGDALAAYQIDVLIEAIGTVSYSEESLAKITAARDAYDAASAAAQALVTMLDTLTAAESAYETLAALAVADVKSLIDALPASENLVYPDDADAVAAAQEAYDALLDAEKDGFDPTYSETLAGCASRLEELKSAYQAALLDEALEGVLGYIQSTVTNPDVGSISGEWAVLALARAGEVAAEDTWTSTYLTNLDAAIAAGDTITSATDYERVTLAVTALGLDASDYNGVDLTSAFSTYDDSMLVNAKVFALIALNSRPYTSDATSAYVSGILAAAVEGGGWTYFGTSADVDMTAMAIQALAPYYDTDAAVKAAVDAGLTALRGLQDETTGGFLGWGSTTESSTCSTAQVVTALCALGIDPASGEWVTSSDESPLTALMAHYDAEEGFFGETSASANQMATEQAAYALVAYYRFVNDMNTLYDMSDATGSSAYSVTGQAAYGGGQTGTLYVGVYTDDALGTGAVEPVAAELGADVTLEGLTSGTGYYFGAFIDSDENGVRDAAEARGATQFDIVSEDVTGLTAILSDPDLDTNNLPDYWEALYADYDGGAGIGDPDDDADRDGYTNGWELTNGTDPTVQDEAGGEGYDSSTDRRVAPEGWSAVRSHGDYRPGQSFEVTLTIGYTGNVTALGVVETIPEGWSYVSARSAGGMNVYENGASGVEFSWLSLPEEDGEAVNPFNFTYTLKVPEEACGAVTFIGCVFLRIGEGVEESFDIEDTVAEPYAFHSADYNPADWSLNLSELLRVIQLYNLGAYHCDPLGEDGFNPGSGDYSDDPHSADYNPCDGAIGLSELLRVIQFYNTGGYYTDPDGEDGYHAGVE